ncbi:MAG TPA: NAD(P)/FAD-dependent oxidoreductase [Vicinamibacteria bacterium]|nr:NAD(P)/FAD-dependent oxidoreductase [Vicinamibacteria bacterium]
MRARALVIGGGPAGIRAAHRLAKGGVETTLLESAPVLGGLASSFDVQGVTIERYYHFICKGDDDLVEALGEIGLSGKLHWKDSRMAYFVDGTLYPFLTPVELLRFGALPLVDRLRAGLAVKLAQRMKEEDLAPRRATAWLRELFGERAYRVIWEPLMRFKFAEHADSISAAWIWARMVRLGRSRTSPWREELGYIEGGSQTVLEGLRRDFEGHGGKTLLSAPVEAIVMADGRASGVRVGGETLPADLVVSTVTPRHFLRLAEGFPEGAYKDGLRRIPAIGIFCLFLRLRESVTPFFWVNTNDPRVPFAGMIEYTNLNPLPELGGDRILYVPQYLSPDDPRYAQSDEDVFRSYTDALALIQPAFDRRWVKFHAVFRDRHAQPICLTDYRETTPKIATPLPNLFLTDSCQLHPHDRTISGSMSLGREAARLALTALPRA